METELVIKLITGTLILGTVFGAYLGYALRGPKVAKLQETIDTLRQSVEAAQEALG